MARPRSSRSSSSTLLPRGARAVDAEVGRGAVVDVAPRVGGGSTDVDEIAAEPLVTGSHSFRSRLLVGTGKYTTLELMRDCLDASGSEVVPVAVRRERLFDREGRSLIDFLDPARYTILPNTPGCFSSDDALRSAPLGR